MEYVVVFRVQWRGLSPPPLLYTWHSSLSCVLQPLLPPVHYAGKSDKCGGDGAGVPGGHSEGHQMLKRGGGHGRPDFQSGVPWVLRDRQEDGQDHGGGAGGDP